MNKVFKLSLAALCTSLSFSSASVLAAEDTIKVGVLHSLSGTMAISETTLKDTVLMLIDEQNKKGGLLGKKLEPVVVDPASNWPLFAEKARELIEKKMVLKEGFPHRVLVFAGPEHKKLARFLEARGFSQRDIRVALDAVIAP